MKAQLDGESATLNVRSVVETDCTKTTAPESLALAGEDSGAKEARMVADVVARGKASGNASRARRRAERALAEGRTPGRPGPKPSATRVIVERVRELVEARDPRVLEALAALVPEAGDLR